MAPLAIVAIVATAAGQAVSAIAQSNALRGQARARQIEGEQDLLASRRQLRQELGEAAVSAGASGLLGSSFTGVFESQAILDAEFLGQIKQRTDFDVANLKQQAKVTLITGLVGAAASAAGGIAGAKGDAARLDAARSSAAAQDISRSQLTSTGGAFPGSVFRKPGLKLRRTGT